MRPAIIGSDEGVIMLHGSRVSARARALADRPTTASLMIYGNQAAPTDGDMTRWLAALADHGYDAVRSGALTMAVAAVFANHGFRTVQELALLRADRPSWRHPPRRPTRSMVAADVPAVVAVDRAAFVDGWGMDDNAIADVCQATPAARARVVEQDGRIVGVALTGRDGDLGFLQRVAVDPRHHGAGHASTLVADALRWLGRHRVRSALVNTHVENTAALALYARHGFILLDERLLVTERTL